MVSGGELSAPTLGGGSVGVGVGVVVASSCTLGGGCVVSIFWSSWMALMCAILVRADVDNPSGRRMSAAVLNVWSCSDRDGRLQ